VTCGENSVSARNRLDSKMRVLFVVEAGFRAGLGHLLRCRVLLQELWIRGHRVDLWLYGDDTALAGRGWPADMKLFQSVVDETASKVCDSISRLQEKSRYDWLVVDGYRFSGKAHCEQFAAHDARLMMLDDLADRELKADIILNQNTSQVEAYAGSNVVATRFLLGPQYALIDRVYCPERNIPHSLNNEVRQVLLTFGGVDRNGRTLKVVDLLAKYKTAFEIVVVTGLYFPYVAELKGRSGNNTLRVVQNISNLAKQMHQCDLMITAGGSTVWQACCSGVPMLVLQTVKNQSLVIKTLLEFNAALCLDATLEPHKNAGIQECEFTEVFSAVSDAAVRSRLSVNALQLVDGQGVGRVTQVLGRWE